MRLRTMVSLVMMAGFSIPQMLFASESVIVSHTSISNSTGGISESGSQTIITGDSEASVEVQTASNGSIQGDIETNINGVPHHESFEGQGETNFEYSTTTPTGSVIKTSAYSKSHSTSRFSNAPSPTTSTSSLRDDHVSVASTSFLTRGIRVQISDLLWRLLGFFKGFHIGG